MDDDHESICHDWMLRVYVALAVISPPIVIWYNQPSSRGCRCFRLLRLER